MRKPDVAALVSGVALIAFGGALVADATGTLDLGFASVAPIVCGAVGAILLVLGLSRGV